MGNHNGNETYGRNHPTRGQIKAAQLIMKRHREGKGNVEITPRIAYLASLSPATPKIGDVTPTRGQIMAAQLIMKRDKEGKGKVEITPWIVYLASLDA